MNEASARFFEKPEFFRAWLEKNHNRKLELWVGFNKKGSGVPSITWPESVDQALCFGWIDGVRKSIDGMSYQIRFTPRKKTSHWSSVNIRRVAELTQLGLMQPSGLVAFSHRTEARSNRASYEQGEVVIPIEYLNQLKENRVAWKFFQSITPSKQKTIAWWIVNAKKQETKQRRVDMLVEFCSNQQMIHRFSSVPKSKC